MSHQQDLSEIYTFLPCETPREWVECALKNEAKMLIDHAHCERKAASTAINLMYRYPDRLDLQAKMSRLAREELRHFEQVLAILKKRNIPFRGMSASRYAGEMRKYVRKNEPGQLVDVLIIGAFIEARSCERFAKISPYLDDTLKKFYLSLLKSEARHYQDYLTLARDAAGGSIDERVAEFADLEKNLILGEDEQFRFHSGVKKCIEGLGVGE
ncbi:tRNA-(ms[2]io[6]A)-hydroxylase [Alkalimarinus alittae]|uniref:tRNA-(Ms[2]io[6]A)-hydroxylase n=1 Tax=Alkalimarinus alittae TaxID=2961619 RepID=A0ABY6MXW9_9ALTE|nr:tRNA-(ms[2]io[6]A)-hydroxylase [Alkalimarinus alittae]UZE94676.1 tRNA-(ms[2]io[6]A)-hydroxylase [Alkalimarinus alittae]